MQEQLNTLSDYTKILKRRKWSFVLPALFCFLLAAAIALLLPSIYRSASTILIEQQEIPQTLVATTITSYAEQRIQMINQRIMSFPRLMGIINRFNLYSELKDRWTSEEIVEKLRDDIKLKNVGAEVVDPRTGRPTSATIAFNLSYEGKNPNTVQQVASVLTSLYLEENLKVREQQTKETTQFLEDEMKLVKSQVAELESAIASFKEKHVTELPELLQINLQSQERMEREVAQLNDQIRSLKEREGYLETQLASIPVESGDEDKKRLEQLKIQLINLRTKVSEEYPDVIKTKREIAELEKQRESSTKWGKSAVLPMDRGYALAGQSDNPAYITIASQLTSTRIELESLSRQKEEIRRKSDHYRQRIEGTPRVEQAYKALLIERDNTQLKYNELMAKYMEARLAHGLEKEQKGERFTLIDPPRLPEEPVKPNRLAILLIGLVLGIGAGVGSSAIREFSDQSVHSAEILTLATSFPVLASIPEIETARDRTRKYAKRGIITAIIVLAIIGGLIAFHYLIMDLDVFWVKVTRQLKYLRL